MDFSPPCIFVHRDGSSIELWSPGTFVHGNFRPQNSKGNEWTQNGTSSFELWPISLPLSSIDIIVIIIKSIYIAPVGMATLALAVNLKTFDNKL